jgi:hypothetical protein
MIQVPSLPSVPSSTVNILIGAGITLIGTWLFNWNRRRIERKRLRRVLTVEIFNLYSTVNEIKNKSVFPDENYSAMRYWTRPLAEFDHPYYDANQDSIQKLSRLEIVSLTEFYYHIDRLRDQLLEGHTEDTNDIEILTLIQIEVHFKAAKENLRKGLFDRWQVRQRARYNRWTERLSQYINQYDRD